MERSEVIKFLILRTIGNFLVLAALSGVIITFGQALYQEAIYRINFFRGVHYVVDTSPNASNQRPVSGFADQTEALTAFAIEPIDREFSIVIPKINANARILADVDAANYESYMGALALGVAHAKGSAMPGMKGSVYLFAHSTDYFWNVGRYNAVFYLLKELEVGDEIDIFYQGERNIYIVNEKRIVGPKEVSYITGSTEGEERLTLQTCWPPGTTLKRLLVFAKPKRA